jgi:hypothetical protein
MHVVKVSCEKPYIIEKINSNIEYKTTKIIENTTNLVKFLIVPFIIKYPLHFLFYNS